MAPIFQTWLKWNEFILIFLIAFSKCSPFIFHNRLDFRLK